MENVPKKFAISKRNDWMIEQSGVAVCYVHKVTGGAAKFREKKTMTKHDNLVKFRIDNENAWKWSNSRKVYW